MKISDGKHEAADTPKTQDTPKTAAARKAERQHRLEEEAKTMSVTEIAERIAELNEELAILQRPPFQEYPKKLPDGRTVASRAEEDEATAPAKQSKH